MQNFSLLWLYGKTILRALIFYFCLPYVMFLRALKVILLECLFDIKVAQLLVLYVYKVLLGSDYSVGS